MDQLEQTKAAFREKWDNNSTAAFDGTLKRGSPSQDWILQRNGWASPVELRDFLADKQRIMDAGCGNGRVTALLQQNAPAESQIVGFDIVSANVARENLKTLSNVEIFAGDLLADLSSFGQFDFIYCQEVLHHTADPQRAFNNLVNTSLAPGGEIAIYVYKLKAAPREFVDDYLRAKLNGLSYEEAMTICRQITELGRNLSDLNTQVDVPAIPALGVQAGRYEIQRFFYHFFMKCFWNPDLSFDDNATINFDWYSPQICKRYNTEDVCEWFRQAELKITQQCTDHYGITIRGQKTH